MLKTDETDCLCELQYHPKCTCASFGNTIPHSFLHFCMKLNTRPAQRSRASGVGLPSVELLLPRSAELQNQIEGSRQDIVLPHK